MKNVIGREVPEYIEGIGKTDMFIGAWEKLKKGWMDEPTIPPPNKAKTPHLSKICTNLEEAIKKTSPKDGMTVSFHHHLRNGDDILVRSIEIFGEM